MNEQSSVGGNAVYRHYAAERWANAILRVMTSAEDPRTLEHWGRLVGAGRATLATWCRVAHVSPRRSLEFARLLRGLKLTAGKIDELQDVMDIVEPRTLDRLLRRWSITQRECALSEFLRRQTLIRQPHALATLDMALARCETPARTPTHQATSPATDESRL